MAARFTSPFIETLSHYYGRFNVALAVIARGWRSVRFKPSRAAPLGIAIAGGLVVVCGGNSGSAGGGSPERIPDRIRVATTIYPVEYFVGRVGGERIDIVSLIPPGVEAHDFEPKVSDLRDIVQADLPIYTGAEFEPWVDRRLTRPGGVQAGRGAATAGRSGPDPGDPAGGVAPG